MNASLAAAVRRHSLMWLVLANAVGVLLATLLLWPGLNEPLSPLTYGRWVPLHLDWQLYGWCSLPLVGLLFAAYVPDDSRAAFTGRLTLGIWSAGLVFGGASWLGGDVGGKLFLDWHGAAGSFWMFAGLALWAGLVSQAWRRPGITWWMWALLAGLGIVPLVLSWAATPDSYPPVNPHSGGATGATLLASTLGIVAIFGLVPWLLRLPRRGDEGAGRWFAAAFAISLALYAGIGHGDASHHRPDQIAGLGSLLIWLPLTWYYAKAFRWAEGSGRWLGAAFAWWCLLVVTGLLDFLPGVSERVKFTNVMVAHSHLAMAGLITSLHLALLLNFGPARAPSRRSFWLWQAGCAVHIGALLWVGWREGAEPSVLYLRGGVADACYGLRWLAGLAMLAASIEWLATLGRHATDRS